MSWRHNKTYVKRFNLSSKWSLKSSLHKRLCMPLSQPRKRNESAALRFQTKKRAGRMRREIQRVNEPLIKFKASIGERES